MPQPPESIPGFSSIKTIALRLKPGEDLKAALDHITKTHHIPAACIISCVGSLKQVALRYAGKNETELLNGKFEIVSLAGTLSENGSHLHISISDENGKTTGGHLKEGSLVFTTAEIIIGILTDLVFEREVDHTYGYHELVVKQRAI